MQSEKNALCALLDTVLKILRSGEYLNHDLIREFLNIRYYLDDPRRGIADVEGTLYYATDVMEKAMREFRNPKHPRFVQADALRRMAEAALEFAESPDAGMQYATEAYKQIEALYLK